METAADERIDGWMKELDQEGVGNASTAFKTDHNIIVVVVQIDLLLKRTHPFGETGRLTPSLRSRPGNAQAAGRSSGQGRSASEPRSGFSLDGCEHGGMLHIKGRLMHHVRINI